MKMADDLKELYDYVHAVEQEPKEGDVRTLAFCLMSLIRVIAERENASEDDDPNPPHHDQDAAMERVKLAGSKQALTDVGLLRKPTA